MATGARTWAHSWGHIRGTAEMSIEATMTHVALSQEAASDIHPNEGAMGTEVWTR